jgi:hypothetical protein
MEREATDTFYSKYRFCCHHPYLADGVFPVGLSMEGEYPPIGRYSCAILSRTEAQS